MNANPAAGFIKGNLSPHTKIHWKLVLGVIFFFYVVVYEMALSFHSNLKLGNNVYFSVILVWKLENVDNSRVGTNRKKGLV